MRIRATIALTAAAALTLAGCSSEPKSADGLMKEVGKLGYTCTVEPNAESGAVAMDCGEGLTLRWHDSPAEEAETFNFLVDTLRKYPGTLSVTRSGQWRASGKPGDVQKVAEALDKQVVVIGK